MAPLWPRPLTANIDWTFGFPEQKGVTGAYFIIFLRQGLSTIEFESEANSMRLLPQHFKLTAVISYQLQLG